MVVGRLFHYGVDLALISITLAGVKRTSGFGIPEGTPKSIADGYLRFGEGVFDYVCGAAYASPYFVREGKEHSK